MNAVAVRWLPRAVALPVTLEHRLGEADRLPLLLENEGLSRRQLTLALRAVLENRHQLTEAWNRIHGQE